MWRSGISGSQLTGTRSLCFSLLPISYSIYIRVIDLAARELKAYFTLAFLPSRHILQKNARSMGNHVGHHDRSQPKHGSVEGMLPSDVCGCRQMRTLPGDP